MSSQRHGWVSKTYEYRDIPQLPNVERDYNKVPVRQLSSALGFKEGNTVLLDGQRCWPQCGLKAAVYIRLDDIPTKNREWWELLDMVSELEKNPTPESSAVLNEIIAAHKAINAIDNRTGLAETQKKQAARDEAWRKLELLFAE